MSTPRKSRRRRERQRAKKAPTVRRLSVPLRLAVIAGGVGLVAAGVLLLAAGGSQNASRLGRVAGILILLGVVGIAAGAIGRL